MTEHLTGRRPEDHETTGPLPWDPSGAAGDDPDRDGRPPWSVLCDADAVLLRRPGAEALRSVPSGRQVAVTLDGPLARWRLRRLTRRCGVHVDRELVAVPSTRRPIAVFDDEESAVRHFWAAVVTVPPGVTGPAPLLTVALRLARRMPWTWTGALVPTRVVIGRRS